tara:strand:+ start:226 stop:486 length:261 start_codon:yes stop_codon:yes gene_type:complete
MLKCCAAAVSEGNVFSPSVKGCALLIFAILRNFQINDWLITRKPQEKKSIFFVWNPKKHYFFDKIIVKNQFKMGFYSVFNAIFVCI